MPAIAPERRTMNAGVRPYRPEDREAVRRIYADTAFFGEPVEAYFDDRELFADLGINAYLDHFPDYVFVASEADNIVGYILGCPSGDSGIRAYTVASLPRLLLGVARKRYRLGQKTIAYALANLQAVLHGELLEVRSALYPANLHVNVVAEARGRGLGASLLSTYLEKLRSENIAGVHLVTTDRNLAAVRLYRRYGFELLAERPSRLWHRHLGRQLQLLAFGLRL